MRIIKSFEWCRKYGLEYIEVDFDIANRYIIIHKAKKIRRIRHMLDVLKWSCQYQEYRYIFNRWKIFYVCKWLWFNFFADNNAYLKYGKSYERI